MGRTVIKWGQMPDLQDVLDENELQEITSEELNNDKGKDKDAGKLLIWVEKRAYVISLAEFKKYLGI